MFDLFASCRNAATLVLIGESLGKDPVRLGNFLADRRISVWYSAPSILALLTEHGRLDRPDLPVPRLVLFAGEVFPIAPLRRLRALWSKAAMWNLYGPTETNVCTGLLDPRDDPRRSHGSVPDRAGLPSAPRPSRRRVWPRRAAGQTRRAGHRRSRA